MNQPKPQPERRPHPVTLDVAYPERHSRWLVLIKWLLVIPQAIIAYLLSTVLTLLAIIAWFAILFTGRYPRSMHDFSTGVQRWCANVFAYWGLLRDEYPPFSFDPGLYALTLEIPYPERQSRFRLFIRLFAIIPNQIVFTFVMLGWMLTSFIAWWAILITGHYPRGLFKFSVGVMRWWNRQASYYYLLRDEYPPYSVSANARAGNEVVSAIIGLPLFAAYVTLYIAASILPFLNGGETVTVSEALLDEPGRISTARPSADAGSIRITLTDFDGNAFSPDGVPAFSFDVEFEKDGFLPAFYAPFLFFVDDCTGERVAISDVDGTEFRVFFRDGTATSTIYFEGFPLICSLEYFTGSGTITFKFE